MVRNAHPLKPSLPPSSSFRFCLKKPCITSPSPPPPPPFVFGSIDRWFSTSAHPPILTLLPAPGHPNGSPLGRVEKPHSFGGKPSERQLVRAAGRGGQGGGKEGQNRQTRTKLALPPALARTPPPFLFKPRCLSLSLVFSLSFFSSVGGVCRYEGFVPKFWQSLLPTLWPVRPLLTPLASLLSLFNSLSSV